MRRCFTLIELLVVIAIIAILAGMLLPALGQVKRTVAGTQCISQERNVYIAMNNYADEFSGYIPGDSTIKGASRIGVSGMIYYGAVTDGWYGIYLMGNFIKRHLLGISDYTVGKNTTLGKNMIIKYWLCPLHPYPTIGSEVSGFTGSYWTYRDITAVYHKRIEQMKRPSQVVMILEGFGNAAPASGDQYMYNHGWTVFDYLGPSRANRLHRGKSTFSQNAVMIDGHSAIMTRKDFGNTQNGWTEQGKITFGYDSFGL